MAKVSGWSLPKARNSFPPHMTKTQIATVLEQSAILLELDGANKFRVIAYQNASRALSSLEEDLLNAIQEKRITEIKGIGKGIGGLITEAVLEGTWGGLNALYDRVPKGLVEMIGIPGLGPKRARQLYESLRIDSIESLKFACKNDQISSLPGFGKKSQEKYLEGIELLRRYQGRSRMDIGLAYGHALEKRIMNIPKVVKAQLAGSARRRRETIGDLDIVLGANIEDHSKIIQEIMNFPGIAEVKGQGSSKISLILEADMLAETINVSGIDAGLAESLIERSVDATIDAQIRIVNPESFPFTLAYFTGSKEHNIRMRQIAIEKGLRLNEFGLFSEKDAGDKIGIEAAKNTLICSNESDIYQHLGLKWVPPELREDMGEIEAAKINNLPNLVELQDLKGSFHNHTIASDGSATLEEMSNYAMKIGWEYLGIADHSESLNIGGKTIGIPSNEIPKQKLEIDELNIKWKEEDVNFRIFHGSECDIMSDGSLDYSEEVRSSLSHIVGSVHALGSWRNRDEYTNTEALIKAIEDPTFTILGHPTGRILQGREGFPIDMHAILRRMGEINSEGVLKAVEINASPYRLDMDWRLCKYAKELGVPICINPDAHNPEGLKDVWFGTQIARKGWLESKDILNTKTVQEIENLLGQ
ncbi:MAG: helix-hairpin-helix domain-containing protein [Candidatus Poseidoniales archaeon]|jgi:DNA polymerase (family 10)|tara:strand:- start:421 stop:2355 length:1935 start_codon:yes stop_codon:yes gene_type:complete